MKYLTYLNYLCYFVIIFILISHFLSLFSFFGLNWDESVYIKTAEYLVSNGERGLLENLRPLGFPILLIPFQLFQNNEIFISRILSFILLVITLLIIKNVFQKLYGVLIKKDKELIKFLSTLSIATILLFPEFFDAAIGVRPEIAAMFFFFLGIYLVIDAIVKERVIKPTMFLLSGIFVTFAFYIRFVYGVYLVPTIFFVVIITKKSKLTKRSLIYFISGSFLVALFFSIFHYFLYKAEVAYLNKSIIFSFFYPIINQFSSHTSKYVWYYVKPIYYYLFSLYKWFPLMLGFIPALCFQLGQIKNSNKKTVNVFLMLFLLLPLLFLSITKHKEFRYILVVLPWIVFYSVYFYAQIFIKIKKGTLLKYTYSLLLLFFLIYLFFNNIHDDIQHLKYRQQDNIYVYYYYKLENIPASYNVLTSTPKIKTNAKVDIGYYDEAYYFEKLANKHYDFVYYTDDSFPCNNSECYSLKNRSLSILESDYEVYYEYDNRSRIYVSKTLL